MNAAEFVYSVLLKPPLLRKLANALLTMTVPKTRRVRGAVIHLNPDDPVVSGALTWGVYEREEIAFFCRWFGEGMVFLDVGANVGLYTGLALRRIGEGGAIVCVEPDPSSRSFLEQTVAANLGDGRRVRVVVSPVAASDGGGTLTLYKNPANKGDNRLYRNPLCTEEVAVPAGTVDSLCRDAGIGAVNFVKLDVQGAEGKVCLGARQILGNSPDCVLMSEFWPHGLRQCGSDPEDYLGMLRAMGFRLFEMRGKRLAAIDDNARLIAGTPGRMYKNIVGVKGKYLGRLGG
jgi:FkbM family methyltransferase